MKTDIGNIVLAFWLGALLVAAFAMYRVMKKHGPTLKKAAGSLLEKEDANKKWEATKQVARSIIFISAALLLGNWLLAEIGWEFWWTYWRNGPFMLSQFAILFSVYVLMTSKSNPPRLFAWALLSIVFMGWVSVASRHDSKKQAAAIEADRVTELLREKTETVPVAKGQIYKVYKVDLRGVSEIPLWVRYDGRGEFKRQNPSDFNRPGGINRSDAHVRTIELMSKDEGFNVVVRTD